MKTPIAEDFGDIRAGMQRIAAEKDAARAAPAEGSARAGKLFDFSPETVVVNWRDVPCERTSAAQAIPGYGGAGGAGGSSGFSKPIAAGGGGSAGLGSGPRQVFGGGSRFDPAGSLHGTHRRLATLREDLEGRLLNQETLRRGMVELDAILVEALFMTAPGGFMAQDNSTPSGYRPGSRQSARAQPAPSAPPILPAEGIEDPSLIPDRQS